jgi:hypothetical protein
LEGRNNNTEHLKRRKEKTGTERGKEDQDGLDNPEYGAGKH